ncbi:DNA mismatch repair protein MutS [Gordonia effusa NBRC 100432]|uniref:DNA mismatch repair protein MutS n=2 Tax=Gordonia effusa TaxID=263908 RepID=H0QZ05_9ACTN|nr:DNA mismatch repair protein MutS [Gordonia effusa NBRC 100432]
MYPDRDCDVAARAPDGAHEVMADLGLSPIIAAMGGDDPYLCKVATVSLFDAAASVDSIVYRQQGVADAASNLATVQSAYAIAVAAGEDLRKHVRISIGRTSPERFMYRSRSAVELLSRRLAQLTALMRDHREKFTSPPFSAFCAYLADTFDRDYLAAVRRHLDDLEFTQGALISAGLGRGNAPTGYLVRQPHRKAISDLVSTDRGYGFRVDRHDPTASELLGDVRGRGLHEVAATLADAADNLERFFATVQWELGFHLGAVRLQHTLLELGGAMCWPVPEPRGSMKWRCRGLYDAGFALRRGGPLVGNDADTGGAALLMITGANQGGKSTFLRSIGVAQMMMQAGLPIAATEFAAGVRSGVHTHFTHAEDPSMTKGHLDEELERMSRIIDRLAPGALILLDESFASTNEHEATGLAAQIVEALIDSGHQLCYVTHMYELARRFYDAGKGHFIRAQRCDDESRPFHLVSSGPMETSYGVDLYRAVFGVDLPAS